MNMGKKYYLGFLNTKMWQIWKPSYRVFGVVPIALQKKALRQMLSAKSSPPKALQI